MRVLALALALLLPSAAAAQSCLPTPIEQTDTRYVVDFGGPDRTSTQEFAKLSGDNGDQRAAALQKVLQFRSDTITPLQELIRDGDLDGYNDPELLTWYHSNALGDRNVPIQQKTHITNRCAIVTVEWNSVTKRFDITWSVP